ncbi:molybdopterin-dependent oxidoreductase [Salidesulfovibrio onnuriiensis]|uniref:molybdopterin-dependent oxidoreductase n=1 Tax=Salidesulfovibrio onnuriiensis TaxID=2583823 RepID=UPI0011C8309C|nr:molybdopterin-dependent oxidoreductase [Salidesulfovibrio onnuriiensis]
MTRKRVYSVCGMCTVRCPIMAEVEDGKVKFIKGNPHDSGMKGALCPRGAAGNALITDDERPQYPMIRDGERGEGKWRRVSWDEALDYVAGKLKGIIQEHGPESVLWSDRGGPFRDLHMAFMRGLGSPNYCNHDASCARNVQHAAKSVMGMGRKDVSYDYRNCRHLVLQTRNIFEAINVKEVNGVLDGRENGCEMTVIDIRATVSAGKADNFFMIRPGTDYAFNLAVIHVLLAEDLYNKEFVSRHVRDLDKLRAFVGQYTPEWAEQETGVPAGDIRSLARKLSAAAPAVIWHPGWMVARYSDSFYVSRSAYLINALLGSLGAKGGLPFTNKPGDFGRTGLKKFVDLYPKPEKDRADGCGTTLKHIDGGPGLVHLNYDVMVSGDPYPIKAYFIHRHDPLMALPDPDAIREKWRNLDLIVSTTFSWSDSAWFADVILPMSPYLERDSILACKNGLKSFLFYRARAVEPRYETRADWEIICGLAERLGLDKLAFKSLEELHDYQLEGTGVTRADFEATGQVSLSDEAKYRTLDELSFKTKSGKVEVINDTWEDMGLPSLKPYESPEAPPEGKFRITFGRCALHTQGHTLNNRLLSRKMSENKLWINTTRAEALGIKDGDDLILNGDPDKGTIKAYVTDFVHPDCVFMLHGFGHRLPVESRAFNKGVADHELMKGGLDRMDKAGGGLALQEHFVSVSKA